MTDTDNAAEIIKELALAVKPAPVLEPGKVYGYTDCQGVMHALNLRGDEYSDLPARKRGTVTVRDLPSFHHYWERHHDASTEVFSDLDSGTVTAVLDAHHAATAETEFGARWQQHRLVLQLQQTEPWKEWTAQDGRLMSQPDFAEFIEDHARHVYAPDPKAVSGTDLLEIAQHFKAHTNASFTSGHLVKNGQTEFEWTKEIQASAKTSKGTIEIPNQFAIAVKPYDDCDLTVVLVRFRYRLNDGQLALGFKLDDAKGVAREAVRFIVGKLADECGVTVMHGRPA